MSLERADVVDAVGLDRSSGSVVLTILDGWDGADERAHLLALQEKLNAYFSFIEDGQLLESYPQAQGRDVIIDLVTRYPLHSSAETLLQEARTVARQIDVSISTRQVRPST